jgi:hypothetical protein
MAGDLIPDDLRDFILKYFDSIAQLEALLLLRENPHEKWTPERTAKRLYIDARQATGILRRLCEDGLLGSQDGVYYFECVDAEKRSLIDMLASIYARRIVPVTNIIHSKTHRIQEFADAFRIKKKDR